MNAAHVLRTHGRLLAVLAFVALLLMGVRLTGAGEHFELAALRQDIAGHRLEGVLLFMGLFALGNLLLIPGWVFLASAVYAFGALAGGAGHVCGGQRLLRVDLWCDPVARG